MKTPLTIILILAAVSLLALLPAVWDDPLTTRADALDPWPDTIRVRLVDHQPVNTDTITRVEWDNIVTITGDPPAELVGGDLVFTDPCFCVVEAHMDWPLDTADGMRRMDVRLDHGGHFNRRIAAAQIAPGGGDGYTHTSSGPMFFEAGDIVYTDVKQMSGVDSVLQATNVTWLMIWEMPHASS